MTSADALALDEPGETEPSEDEIHARAWAMVEGVADSECGRIALLHAAATLMSSRAIEADDPFEKATKLLQVLVQDVFELTAAADDLKRQSRVN